MKCGIVGLPNVGKSTLFNALTQTASAQAANFPFCTIEPNVGRVAVPDERLEALEAIVKPERVLPTSMEFVDIAGLVKGAHKGEGLGNQFLGNIREVEAILHVVRCFEDDDITHVENKIDPLSDIETIETELILADLGVVEKRLGNVNKQAKGGDKNAKLEADFLSKIIKILEAGNSARIVEFDEAEAPIMRQLKLLTAKPVLYVCNVDENSASEGNSFSAKVISHAKKQQSGAVIISASIESEISTMEKDEQKAFLEDLGLAETGLDRIIKESYKLLDLITFFTAGVKEVRAWTVKKGGTAPNAAGRIHTDFEKGFIRAETISYQDFIDFKGEQGAKDAGKLRQEGKEYIVQDGDIMHFKFNV